MTWALLLVALGVVVLAAAVLWPVMRQQRARRRAALLAAARRVDPTDPNALAALPLDALDDLSRSIVVEVDNAVRTSDNELAFAVEEFGDKQTEPFLAAVGYAKATLAQAFGVRQQLDDAIPKTLTQRRDLLTRVVVAAAQADRRLEAQREAFGKLRDLVVNAPARLDGLTRQLVDVTAGVGPKEQKLAELRKEFDNAALVSIEGNVHAAKERLSFVDHYITQARELAARAASGQQAELVDCVRATESALGQARSLLDAIDGASSDIRRAAIALPAAIADIQAGINQAGAALQQPATSSADQRLAAIHQRFLDELAAARDRANKAVAAAQSGGSRDPLGSITQLTKAHADMDRLLADIAKERAAAERLSRVFDQALLTAQSRVRAVSDYIDTRRGSIGPDARTRLSEAVRKLDAAQANRSTDLNQATADANGASTLADEAQSLALGDVGAAQAPSVFGAGGFHVSAMTGGIIINVQQGFGQGSVRFAPGWSPTSFGGSLDQAPFDWPGRGGRS